MSRNPAFSTVPSPGLPAGIPPLPPSSLSSDFTLTRMNLYNGATTTIVRDAVQWRPGEEQR